MTKEKKGVWGWALWASWEQTENQSREAQETDTPHPTRKMQVASGAACWDENPGELRANHRVILFGSWLQV